MYLATARSMNGLGRLGAVMPGVNITLQYKGRSITVAGGWDSGADPEVTILDQTVADQLGLPKGQALTVIGAGGAAAAYYSQLDLVRVEGAPKCELKNPSSVVVAPRPTDALQQLPYRVLVGDALLTALRGKIDRSQPGVLAISCQGAAPGLFPVSTFGLPDTLLGIPTSYVLVGGAVLVGGGVLIALLGKK